MLKAEKAKVERKKAKPERDGRGHVLLPFAFLLC
jgi:hypothetical protein